LLKQLAAFVTGILTATFANL